MPRSSPLWLKGLLLGVIVLLLVPLVGGWLYLRASLPTLDGELRVTGLRGVVEIERDTVGIPTIRARHKDDAYFALGFAHAQDRLWQMELRRRYAAGRLAEIVGAPGVNTDRFMRTLGLARVVEQNFVALDRWSKSRLHAYADGVNAYLRQERLTLSPEFTVLGFAPEPWTPQDSLMVLRLMALDLATDWRAELLRLRLLEVLTPEQIADLWRDDQGANATMIAELNALRKDGLHEAFTAIAASRLPTPIRGVGSNAVALPRATTNTGGALLSNDPHLRPEWGGNWYLARVDAPELRVAGATLAGVPLMLLGQNQQIAWGLTVLGADEQDLLIERVDPLDATRYQTETGSEPFRTWQETIEVKDAADVVLNVRHSRNGPIISDALDQSGDGLAARHVLALAWNGLAVDDRSIEAGFLLAEATGWVDFRRALRRHGAPALNVLYADREGRAGLVTAGRVPRRGAGDGSVPRRGWRQAARWQGYVAFDALPQIAAQDEQAVINANQRPAPETTPEPVALAGHWPPGYRAERIAALLDSDGRNDIAGLRAIMLDTRSMLAEDLLPLLLDVLPADAPHAALVNSLRRWDADTQRNRIEPTLFMAWYREVLRALIADELGPLFPQAFTSRAQFVAHVLRDPTSPWCDDRRTDDVTESCADTVRHAWQRAVASTEGGVPWGDVHRLRLDHPVLSRIPVLGRYFRLDLPLPGDHSTVNVSHPALSNEAEPFAVTVLPSYRAIYDLRRPSLSQFHAFGSQSGHPLSPFGGELGMRLWREHMFVPLGLVDQPDASPFRHIQPLARLTLRP